MTKILEAGAAFIDGRLDVGDKLVAVNGKNLEAVTHEEAVATLKSATDRVVLTVIKAQQLTGHSPLNSHFSNQSQSSLPGTRTRAFDSFADLSNTTVDLHAALNTPPLNMSSLMYDGGLAASVGGVHSSASLNNPSLNTSTNYLHDSPRLRHGNGADEYDGGCGVRTVVLAKGQSGLGFNIVGGEDGEGKLCLCALRACLLCVCMSFGDRAYYRWLRQ